jgi:hypothetical protein
MFGSMLYRMWAASIEILAFSEGTLLAKTFDDVNPNSIRGLVAQTPPAMSEVLRNLLRSAGRVFVKLCRIIFQVLLDDVATAVCECRDLDTL